MSEKTPNKKRVKELEGFEIHSASSEKTKVKKIDTRVDFTPMVDMILLLLTFFMFTTTLSKPQVMTLVLPTKDIEDLEEDQSTKVADSQAITIILGEDDKVYYYFGKVTEEMYEDPLSIRETDYSADGLRAILLSRNMEVVREITELKYKRRRNEITEAELDSLSSEIKSAPGGQVIIIKPTDDSSYRNLVDALDEMQICSIGRYALVDPSDGDLHLLRNYLEYRGGGVSPQESDD